MLSRFQAVPGWATILSVSLLLGAAPLLFLPNSVPSWGVAVGLGLLALSWITRGATGGEWLPYTPATLAISFWLLIMLPVAIWVAPPTLRETYSWPRTYVLVWNYSLFATVVAYAGCAPKRLQWALLAWIAAAVSIALVAPFGMEYRLKLPGISLLAQHIPRPLSGMFSGPESGFSSNQLAGALLYVLPVPLTLVLMGRTQRTWQWWGAALCSAVLGLAMLLAQSRGGILGLIAASATILLLTRRRGWLLLGLTTLALIVVIYFLPGEWVDFVSDAPGIDSVGGVSTVRDFRVELWQSALLAIWDYPYTGMGFGTFRVIAPQLYPIPFSAPDFDLAHAHNFFLQTALDFGVPGFCAMLAIYWAALVDLYRLAHVTTKNVVWPSVPWLTWRVLAIGWMGVWVGQSVYSMFDAVAIGSKPSFLWWMWLALIFSAGNLVLRHDTGQTGTAND